MSFQDQPNKHVLVHIVKDYIRKLASPFLVCREPNSEINTGCIDYNGVFIRIFEYLHNCSDLPFFIHKSL